MTATTNSREPETSNPYPRVLYVTRKFPPSIGGMETASYELYRSLNELVPTKLVAYSGQNKWLVLFYPLLLLRSILHEISFRPNVIYLQDGLLSPFIPVLRVFSHAPIVTTIHGLDLTFNKRIYQTLIAPSIGFADQIIANSRNTERLVQDRFPAMRTAVVHYGVLDTFYSSDDRSILLERFKELFDSTLGDISERPILATTGRLVHRKGVAWFVDNVMPIVCSSDSRILYLIAGSGPDLEDIQHKIHKHGLEDNVVLLGRISNQARDLLYNITDLFVMPNISVPGDVEGFGLVATEASSCGTPIAGADLDGVSDAIIPGATGIRLPSEDPRRWAHAVASELQCSSFNRTDVRVSTLEAFSWHSSAASYLEIFKSLAHRESRD